MGLNLLTETDIASFIIYNTLPPGFLFLVDTEEEDKNAEEDDFGDRIKFLYNDTTD